MRTKNKSSSLDTTFVVLVNLWSKLGFGILCYLSWKPATFWIQTAFLHTKTLLDAVGYQTLVNCKPLYSIDPKFRLSTPRVRASKHYFRYQPLPMRGLFHLEHFPHTLATSLGAKASLESLISRYPSPSVPAMHLSVAVDIRTGAAEVDAGGGGQQVEARLVVGADAVVRRQGGRG